MGWILKAIGLVIFFAILQVRGELQGFLIFLGVALGVVILFKAISSEQTSQTQQSPSSTETQAMSGPPPSTTLRLSEIQSKEPENYYELLGIGPTSSVERIKDRCLAMAEQCRPDIHANSLSKRALFDRVESAYATLTDPDRRKQYDHRLQHALKRNAAHRNIDKLISKHADDLLRKRRQLIADKGYGIEDRSAWVAEEDYFIREVVERELGRDVRMLNMDIRQHIDSQLDAILKTKDTPATKPLTGIEFEQQCAAILERSGWTVTTTPASGDQGADVIAKKGKKSIVLQCKLYSKPVGNAAVQEAFAAKSHYGTAYAAVVTNAGYTKGAAKLAASTGVLLLHHEELPNLMGKLVAAK
jgi:restriction system protein